MKNIDNLDRIIESTRDFSPDAAQAAEAGERVRAKLFGAGSAGVSRIRGCADFRSLFPAHLAKTASDARRMLVDDHLRECVECRHAFDELRGVRSNVRAFVPRAETAPPSRMKWAIAAAVTLTAGATAWSVYRLGPGMSEPLVAVQTVDGSLYHLASNGAFPAGEGQQFQAGEEIRTPIGSKAVLRLFDGSLIEMNERSELSVVRGWNSTKIRLERGNIIVQAAKQKRGTLQVASGDAVVTVRGTIFSVNRGTRGSRVSVVEGAVEVAQAGRNESLKPGGQTTTDSSLATVPVKEEVAWSRDAARYLALLGELGALERKLESVPGPAPRYSSRLAQLIPADTRVFVAIPNIGGNLGEFKRLFDEQLRESPMLADWWGGASNASMRKEVESMIAQVQKLSTYLGGEVVVSLPLRDSSVLVLAEVQRDGLAEFLKKELPDLKLQEGRQFAVHKGYAAFADSPERLAMGIAGIDRGASAQPSPLQARVQQAYQNGAGWLVCADVEQILSQSVKSNHGGGSPMNLGFDNARFLVLERRDAGGRANTSATLTFDGERKGVASWLGPAGPLKTLDYVSPNAGVAASAVTKNPRLMVEDIYRILNGSSTDIEQRLGDFERRTGVSVMNDLAASLGSEITFALDGPVLPTPAWKLALEVLAPQKLQWSIEKLVEAVNREVAAREPGQNFQLSIASETTGGRAYYKIAGGKLPFEIHYTYADGYLVGGSSRGQVISSLDGRRGGINLARSDKFRNSLPYGSNPNFSAVLYHDLGGAYGPIAEQLKATGYGSPEFQKGLDSVKDMKASLVGIYGGADRITASSAGSVFGLNLSMIGAIHQGKFPLMIPGLEVKRERPKEEPVQ